MSFTCVSDIVDMLIVLVMVKVKMMQVMIKVTCLNQTDSGGAGCGEVSL